jgi:hypothetical protein
MEFLIVWSVLAIITIVHVLVFGFAFKKYFSNLPSAVNAILRGLAVGICVNYFLFFISSLFYGGYTFLLVIYGLPFSITISIVTAFIFWLALSKLEINLNLVELLASITMIGVITGIVIGAFLIRPDENTNGRVIFLIIYFCSINITSGIMLTEKKLYY